MAVMVVCFVRPALLKLDNEILLMKEICAILSDRIKTKNDFFYMWPGFGSSCSDELLTLAIICVLSCQKCPYSQFPLLIINDTEREGKAS